MIHVRPTPGKDHAENTVVMDADELAAPSRSLGTSVPLTVASLQTTLEPMHALRVAVQSGSGRGIVLRLFDEGESAPAGMQEAVLVPFARKA